MEQDMEMKVEFKNNRIMLDGKLLKGVEKWSLDNPEDYPEGIARLMLSMAVRISDSKQEQTL